MIPPSCLRRSEPLLALPSCAIRRIVLLGLASALCLAFGVAGPAGAAPASVTCPTVDSSTGAVSPTPSAGVDWSGCDLSGANLSGADLSNANLTSADLTGANLEDAALDGTELANATLTAASGASITGRPASMPVHWSVPGGYLIGPDSTTYLTDANLSNLNLSGVDFTGLDLLRATFAHSDLTAANLTGADLTGANFTSANLTRADLLGATVSGTWFVSTVWADTTCPNGSKSGSDPHHWCFRPPPGSGFKVTPFAGSLFSDFLGRALSCPSATVCYGGGTLVQLSRTEPLETFQAMLLRWQDGRWLTSYPPFPPGVTNRAAAQNIVASASCTSTSMCVEGGTFGYQGMLLIRSAKKWIAARAPLPTGAAKQPFASVTGLSCPSPKSCTGVGVYTGASGEIHGLILRGSGRVWRAAAAPLPAGSHPDQSLAAVSCPSTTLCFAGGSQNDAAEQPQVLLLSWAGGKWNPVHVALPAGAAPEPDAQITGLACPAVTHCIAVGSYQNTSGHTQGLLITRSGTHWTTAKAPLAWSAASNPVASLNAVSCPTTSRCTAVGTYSDTGGQQLGLVLTWSGKTWKAVPAPLGSADLRAISCPTLTRCVALGDSPSNHDVGLVGP
jgi:hypothetical protein